MTLRRLYQNPSANKWTLHRVTGANLEGFFGRNFCRHSNITNASVLAERYGTMKTIKSTAGKNLLIGGLLASTIFFSTGCTSPTNKWDYKQEWIVKSFNQPEGETGWEPFAKKDGRIVWRKRVK